MRELSLEEIKKTELEIMKFVKKVCEQNGLTYFLCGGTLLGAVRHGGFIPWDDDVDMFMPRKDYMRLISILENESRYRAFSPYCMKNYHLMFTKIVDTSTVIVRPHAIPIENMGVCIDIFPLDGLPSGEAELKSFYKRQHILDYRIKWAFPSYFNIFGGSVGVRFLKYIARLPYICFCRLLGKQRLKKELLALMEKYNDTDYEYMGYINSRYGIKEKVSKAAFAKGVPIMFEGIEFPAPSGYDEYLTSLYGNYMTPPPKDKQVSIHGYKAFVRGDENA